MKGPTRQHHKLATTGKAKTMKEATAKGKAPSEKMESGNKSRKGGY